MIAIAVVLAAITLTAEQPVSVARQGVAAMSLDLAPVSASNGRTMLIAWTDERGPQAVRIDSAGRKLDEHSIGLPTHADAVFWNGGQWVIVNGSGFARIDAEGKVVDRTPRPLEIKGTVFGAVWTGAAALVVTGDADRRELIAWTHDAEMRLTAKTRLGGYALSNIPTPPLGMASTGSSALVVFTDGRTTELYGAFFGRSGLFERTLALYQPPTQSRRAAIGTDGERYTIVVPADLASPTKWTGFVVNRDLTRTNLPVFTVADAADQGPFIASNLAFDGTVHTAYFTYLRDRRTRVAAVRISPRGTVFDSVAAPVFLFNAHEGFTGPPHVQSAGGMTALVYGQRATGRFSFAAARIGASADAIGNAPDLPLSTGPFVQADPIAASGATHGLVAWRENVSPGNPQTMYATRVDSRGRVADPHSIFLGRTSCANASPGAAGDGRDFLVAWHESTAVSASLVRASDGNATPLRVSPATGCPSSAIAVASNGSMYLVVWYERELLAARITTAGTLLDSVPLSFGITDGSAPRIASDGRDFLVAAGDKAFRLTSTGIVFGPTALEGTATQAWWNGRTFVVAVQESGGFRFHRIGSGAGALRPWSGASPFNEGSFLCDARGCSFPVAGFLTRVEEETIALNAIALADAQNLNLAAAGITRFLAYERRVMEDGNATRVFIRPLFTGARRPAVRH